MWLPFGDEPLLLHVVRVLRGVVEPVVVVAAAGQDVPPLPDDVELVRDEHPDRGPLAGLMSGLAALEGRAAAAYASQLDAALPAIRLPALVALAVATLFGAPLFTCLAGIALIFFIGAGDPIASVPLDHYDQVVNPLLATLPLFTLAGFIVTSTRAARRLVRLLWDWTGPLRGAPAMRMGSVRARCRGTS